MIGVDLLLSVGLRLLAASMLPDVARDARAGKTLDAAAGSFLLLTWAIPGCALLAHFVGGA